MALVTMFCRGCIGNINLYLKWAKLTYNKYRVADVDNQ